MNMKSDIDVIYDNMWAQFQVDASQGRVHTDLPPKEGESRWGVSLILKLEQENSSLATRLVQVAQELKPIVGQDQLFYKLTTLHTTVRSIESFHQLGQNDTHWQVYQEIISDLSASLGPIMIHYSGLTAINATVLAQGRPVDNTLQIFRTQLARKLLQNGLQIGPEEHTLRTTAHASLVVFTTAIKNMTQLLDFISENRNTDYGQVNINKVELVQYVRLLSSVYIKKLASFDLDHDMK